jgi:hypothetical protein
MGLEVAKKKPIKTHENISPMSKGDQAAKATSLEKRLDGMHLIKVL